MGQTRRIIFIFALFLVVMPLLAQQGVGINTTHLAPGSVLQIDSSEGALVLPRMTNTQMMAITEALDGAVVFNTTDQNWYIRINEIWTPYSSNETPSLILNKENQTITLTNLPLHMPLNTNHILHNSPGYYEVVGTDINVVDGTIKILREGLYLVTAGMSTTGLPAGPRKYKVLLYVNGVLASYLTSGYINLGIADWWGTSGNSPVLLKENDIVEIKYILDGTGKIPGKFFNIGISKL